MDGFFWSCLLLRVLTAADEIHACWLAPAVPNSYVQGCRSGYLARPKCVPAGGTWKLSRVCATDAELQPPAAASSTQKRRSSSDCCWACAHLWPAL